MAAKFNPFLFYSKQLQDLLIKAAKQKNPALWLHQHKARTILFMLESLTRIHYKAFDEKSFAKWNKRFKKLEDLFGVIDDYIVLEENLKNNKKIDQEILKYFSVQADNHIKKCNKRLRYKDWFNDKMLSFDSSINEFKTKYNKTYSNSIKVVLEEEIDAIIYFALKRDYCFDDIEHVHELRRKLRWLSIYAQAFRGLIQLKKSAKNQQTKINYFTEEVLSSSYNKVERKPKNVVSIQFDHDSFFALSWLIKEFGRIKDKGIFIDQLTDAIYISEKITSEKAKQKALKLLGFPKDTEAQLLEEASEIIKIVLVKDKILDQLIIG